MRPSPQRARFSGTGAASWLFPWLLVLLLALFTTGCVVNPVPTPGEANSISDYSPLSDASSSADGSASAADTASTESDIGESDAGADDASDADGAGVGTEPDVMTKDGQSGDQ